MRETSRIAQAENEKAVDGNIHGFSVFRASVRRPGRTT